MHKERILKILLKIAALFLWYFTPLFILIVLDNQNILFKQGTWFGNLIVRNPYQWDFELMFTGLYLIWGIFIWRASKSIEGYRTFIEFTAWGFLVNALTMVLVGLLKTNDFMHLMTDSVPWFTISFLIFYYKK